MGDIQSATQVRRFRDRGEAGRRLAERLRAYAGRDDVVVLGLPRGGVPVAYEVARELDAPLDVYVVRKLGLPGHEELGFGAIATGGVRVLNKQLIERLRLPPEWVEAIDAKERRELERRERAYRGDRPPPELTRRLVILVDDGLATGSTMLAAVQAVRQDDPAKVVVAVPVAAPEVCASVESVADEVVCVLTPEPMRAVGLWYDDFSQTPDEEVRELLARSRRPGAAGGLGADGAVQVLTGAREDFDTLIERARSARHVLLGEASHGTEEFYRTRVEITKRLIEDGGWDAVAVEADWPDAYRVNRFARGIADDDRTAEEALRGFRRFPVWMWRNTVIEEFVDWLRVFNEAQDEDANKVGFYGLDLYSLHASMAAVVAYLERVDPPAARRARERYACFDQFGRDPQVYAYETGIAGAEPCEEGAVQQLVELLNGVVARSADGPHDADEGFYAEQNARLVVNAERYYRAKFRGGVESWNLRDRHMAEMLQSLSAHLESRGGHGRVAVWEHNSHLGDNRATELGQAGQLNVGQLLRERHGGQALLVGFTTYTGTVTAASDWGAPAERMQVRRALPGSWEELFHESGKPAFMLNPVQLSGRRLERAIGVVYQPQTERVSHYFHTRLADQFDAVIHLDETTALEPLERTSEWDAGELPETYPSGV